MKSKANLKKQPVPKNKSQENTSSLEESLMRLKDSLVLAQSENCTQEILSLQKVIACFERKLKSLKSLN